MIARLLALVALALPVTAHADDVLDPPAWQGVYEGTIGKYPVTVCLQSRGDGDGAGVYYYHSKLKPIRIEAPRDPGSWFEFGEDGERDPAGGARWSLRESGGDTMSGTWRAGRRAFPIALTRTAGSDAGDYWPCGSGAFMARRVTKSEFDRAPDALGSFKYTRLTYRSPPHFSDVAIEGFTFAPSRPGDAAIVKELEAGLPRGSVDDEYIECIGGALGSLGSDGYWEQSSAPGYVDDAFLGVKASLGTFCGGTHPNFGSYQRVFDRVSGKEVILSTWLGDAAWGDTEFEQKPLSLALRELAMRHWPKDTDPECSDAAGEQGYWMFGISAEGFMLTPDFPHVLTACEETVTVPWGEIAPYLSGEGKRGRARMRR